MTTVRRKKLMYRTDAHVSTPACLLVRSHRNAGIFNDQVCNFWAMVGTLCFCSISSCNGNGNVSFVCLCVEWERIVPVTLYNVHVDYALLYFGAIIIKNDEMRKRVTLFIRPCHLLATLIACNFTTLNDCPSFQES